MVDRVAPGLGEAQDKVIEMGGVARDGDAAGLARQAELWVSEPAEGGTRGQPREKVGDVGEPCIGHKFGVLVVFVGSAAASRGCAEEVAFCHCGYAAFAHPAGGVRGAGSEVSAEVWVVEQWFREDLEQGPGGTEGGSTGGLGVGKLKWGGGRANLR